MPLELTDAGLTYHLLNNLYPPVTTRVIPHARRAGRLCRAGRWGARVVPRNEGRTMTRTAGQIVEDLRLGEYVG
jgi:hypothetical protein